MEKEELIAGRTVQVGDAAISTVARLSVRSWRRGGDVVFTAFKRPALVVVSRGSQRTVLDPAGRQIKLEQLATEDPDLAAFVRRLPAFE